MPLQIQVAHDPTCPWCWIGLHQAQALQREFEVEIYFYGAELWPENLAFPEPSPVVPVESRRPETPTRLQLAYAAADMVPPTAPREKQTRCHNVLEVCELAYQNGVQMPVLEAIYRGHWEESKKIEDPDQLVEIVRPWLKPSEVMRTIQERPFRDRIVPFDDEAYAKGIYNVPTFHIDGILYAEQPLSVLKRAVGAALS